MKYLVTYAFEGEYYSELRTMSEIADLIGFRDCSDFCDFRVYRIVKGIPEQLDFADTPCIVTLYTDEGTEIDSAEYPEH